MVNLQVIKKHNDRMALVPQITSLVKIGFNGTLTESLKCGILKAAYLKIAKHNITYK